MVVNPLLSGSFDLKCNIQSGFLMFCSLGKPKWNACRCRRRGLVWQKLLLLVALLRVTLVVGFGFLPKNTAWVFLRSRTLAPSHPATRLRTLAPGCEAWRLHALAPSRSTSHLVKVSLTNMERHRWVFRRSVEFNFREVIFWVKYLWIPCKLFNLMINCSNQSGAIR